MKNLNDIFRSQRILNSVNDDIHRLKKIHKIWFQLLENNVNSTNKNSFNPAILEQCIPVSIRKQTLNIVCESSLIANHIRFIQQELLREISAREINDIKELHISIAHDMHKDTSLTEIHKETNQVSDRDVDLKTIHTLEQFKGSCTSETLRLSTERLITQLKKNVK